MKHRLKASQYAVLLAIILTASIGDTLLSHGMHQVGGVDLQHLSRLIDALANPWVIAGIVCLIGFFASYLTALSWADLTFILPSTASTYVVTAFISHFWLHEHISIYRWTGILLIVCAVGLVSQGPALTEHPVATGSVAATCGGGSALMISPFTIRLWGSITAVVITAVTGDVLTAHAMRNIGDLDEIRASRGLRGAILAVISEPRFAFGVCAMSLSFFSLLYALAPPAPVSLIAPRHRLAHLHR